MTGVMVVAGIYARIQPNQGAGDDSALNAIQLRCGNAYTPSNQASCRRCDDWVCARAARAQFMTSPAGLASSRSQQLCCW